MSETMPLAVTPAVSGFEPEGAAGSDCQWPLARRGWNGDRCGNWGPHRFLGLHVCHRHLRVATDQLREAIDTDETVRRRVRSWLYETDNEAHAKRMKDLREEEKAELRVAKAKERRADRDRGELVYFVQRGGYIKIGHTSRLVDRLKAIGSGGCAMPAGVEPGPVELLATIAGGNSKERTLHRRFSQYRVAGEWFDSAPELLAFIRSVSSTPDTRAAA